FWSLARSGAATSQAAPAPVPSASFLRSRRSLPAGDHVPPLLVNVLAPSLRLAGFQVSITGRFWVSTEGEARRPTGGTGRDASRTRPASAGPARLPFFCVDLLEHVDRQEVLGEHPLELGVLRLELLEPLGVVGAHAAEALPPGVDRLIADPVLLGHHRDGGLVRLAEDLDHLLLGKPALAHVLSVGCGRGSTFKLTPVQFSAGRPLVSLARKLRGRLGIALARVVPPEMSGRRTL